MEAKFAMRGDVLVVELNGKLDFETNGAFQRTCLEKLLSEKVIFDLAGLNFVGSRGLTDLVSTFEQMSAQTRNGVRFCGLSTDFQRLFEASTVVPQTIYTDRERALSDF